LLAWQNYNADSFDAGVAGNKGSRDDPLRVVNTTTEGPPPINTVAAVDRFSLPSWRIHTSHRWYTVSKNPLSRPGRQKSAYVGANQCQVFNHPTRRSVDPRQRLDNFELGQGIGFVPT
jgi:hypothetical protein